MRELDHTDWLVEQEAREAKRYSEQLYRHPDCADPGHPGCVHCADDSDEQQTG